MKTGRIVRCVAISLATLGMCLPQVVFAETAAAPPTPAVVDIALADGGVLHGQVIDIQNGGRAGIPVSVRSQQQEVVRTTTSNNGQFTVQGLRGGVYQVAAGEGQGVYRVWTANAAPPSAQKSAVVYTQNTEAAPAPAKNLPITYTQNAGGAGGGSLKTLLLNPIVIAGVVATAIAVPVAIANSQSASP